MAAKKQKKEKHSRADRAAISYVGYHEWMCGNQEGYAYGKGYEAGFRAGRRAEQRKRK